MKSVSNLLFVFVGVVVFSCTSPYTELVQDELAKEVRNDSLFLGFSFGDSREEFYARGWKLNREGLVMQGPNNQTVKYELVPEDTTRSIIRMLFYPSFDKSDQIKEMEITFDYLGWSPWASKFHSAELLEAVKDTITSWYGGNTFIGVPVENQSYDFLWVKVDGNRRVVLHQKGDKDVYGKISDLMNEEVFEKRKL